MPKTMYEDDTSVEEKQQSGIDDGTESKTPGDDVAVAPFDSLTVISAIRQCFDEAEESQMRREQLNRRNWDAYHARTSSVGKVSGQSNEFVPKLSMALEQIASFIKKGLVNFDRWFTIDLVPDPQIINSPLTESGIEKLIKLRLEDPDEIIKGCTNFATTIEDGVKSAALSSLLILKVHGVWDVCRKWDVEYTNIHNVYTDPITKFELKDPTPAYQKEDLVLIETKVWRLVVELVNPTDFFQDPTGRGLYEIQRTRKDLHQIIDAADAGDYDKEAVLQLAGSFMRDLEVESNLELQTDQPRATPPTFRKEVELWEFWGDLLDSEGNIAHRNCRCVVADGKYLIKKPEPNPYAHGESPFVVSPLIRVPFSVQHKGLFDQAVTFNLILNELFNIAVDGALGASWGINLARASHIMNLDEFTDGIPPGSTLFIDDNVPSLKEVYDTVKVGEVSQETFNMMNLVSQEFNAATLLSDTKLGTLPKKTQNATGLAAAEAASDNFFASIIFDLEQNVIKPTLRLVWLTLLQNVDNWYADDVVGCIGAEASKMLAEMSPARRFANYALGARFKVSGLSTMAARTQEYQKLVVLQQALMQSPILAQAFLKKYSTDKMLQHLFKAINLDPDALTMSKEEQELAGQTMQEVQQMAQMMGGGMQGQGQLQGQPEQQAQNPVQQQQAAIAQQQQLPQNFA